MSADTVPVDRAALQLAEFNLGILRYDWDDPRAAEFAENLDFVNAVAERSPGFVWRLPEEDMDAAQNDPAGPLGGNPRTASTLSVWRDADCLEAFVWKTVHRRFYDRRETWFAPGQGLRLVLWQVTAGHRPTIDEAMIRFRHLETHGPTEFAFGWEDAKSGTLWPTDSRDGTRMGESET